MKKVFGVTIALAALGIATVLVYKKSDKCKSKVDNLRQSVGDMTSVLHTLIKDKLPHSVDEIPVIDEVDMEADMPNFFQSFEEE